MPMFENLTVHPDYLAALGITLESFEHGYFTFLRTELANKKSKDMGDIARRIAEQEQLGKLRVGYISLTAQTICDIPMPFRPHDLLAVSEDMMKVAESVCASPQEQIQIAKSYRELARQAKELGIAELSVRFNLRAAETYVRQRRWPYVADLYWNLALVEAAAGYKGNSLSWLSLSADVSSFLNDSKNAEMAIKLAKDINNNFSRYCAKLAKSEAALRHIEQLHDKSLSMFNKLPKPDQAMEFIMLTDVPGVGRVATHGLRDVDRSHWKHSSSITECLEYLFDQKWPVGIIAAHAVDLRVIARLLQSPELLDNLEPRALERLIAKLLEGFGANVELTKETRDGGYDVGATFEIGDSKYRILIEAKKWKQERKVGIETVDRVLSVRQRLKADKVCIVTTSTFSSVAKQTAAQMKMEMDLVDRDGLMGWIRKYLVPSEGSAIKLPSIKRVPVQG